MRYKIFLFSLEQLVNRLLDTEEKVRLETLLTVFEAAMENFELIDLEVYCYFIIFYNRFSDWRISKKTVFLLKRGVHLFGNFSLPVR